MPTTIIAAAPTVRKPRVASLLAWLPIVLLVALAACQIAASLRYPEIAASISDFAGL